MTLPKRRKIQWLNHRAINRSFVLGDKSLICMHSEVRRIELSFVETHSEFEKIQNIGRLHYGKKEGLYLLAANGRFPSIARLI